MPTDGATLFVMHVALGLVLLVAVGADIVLLRRAGRGSTGLILGRGPENMRTLTGVFASSLGLFAVAIEVSSAAVGHKSFLVVLDFTVLAYLFLFNNWFRNKLIGEAAERTKERR